jgi:hypothetical protein
MTYLNILKASAIAFAVLGVLFPLAVSITFS